MRRIKHVPIATLLALAVVAAAGLGPTRAAAQVSVEAAKKEGEIVWYTGMIIDQIVRPLVAGFKAKYPGIEVRVARYAGPDILLKVQNERQAKRYEVDVVDGTAAIPALINAGFLDKFVPSAAAAYPDGLKAADGTWTAFISYYATAAYNTELVSKEDAPKTYEDLLNPRWKGKMAWADDPSMIGPPGVITNVLATMGQEKGMDYLRKLAQQNIVKVPASQRVVLDQVISGQYPVGLSTLSHHSTISGAKGAPVAWIRMEPVPQVPSAIGLVKDAPHPNAAKLLIDFIVSEEGQQIFREANYIPSHPNVRPKDASLRDDTGGFKAIVLTPQMTADQLQRATQLYKELFK